MHHSKKQTLEQQFTQKKIFQKRNHPIFTFFLLILFQLSMWNVGWGQCINVFNGDKIITTQAEFDAFVNAGYCSVTGNLSISNLAIQNLSGLENITSIGEDLLIQNNAALTSLEGLENITSIGIPFGGRLTIQDNDLLSSLEGLESLTRISSLTIQDNDLLTSLEALENLTRIGGILTIQNNAALISLQGLENTTSINNLSILGNNLLSTLNGLESLTSVGVGSGGSVFIEDNDLLSSLEGLESLTGIGGRLSIVRNGLLLSLIHI